MARVGQGAPQQLASMECCRRCSRDASLMVACVAQETPRSLWAPIERDDEDAGVPRLGARSVAWTVPAGAVSGVAVGSLEGVFQAGAGGSRPATSRSFYFGRRRRERGDRCGSSR